MNGGSEFEEDFYSGIEFHAGGRTWRATNGVADGIAVAVLMLITAIWLVGLVTVIHWIVRGVAA